MTDVAVVTGTSTGMGLWASVELARRGLTVIATMRDTARAGPLREAASEAGVQLDIRALDVTDHPAARSALAGIAADHGRVDVLINNAGRGSLGNAEQLTIGDVQDQLDVNYLGPVALTQAVLPAMREARHGRILTVTSVGGAVGQPFADAYCGAKFAVEGFMQSLAATAEPFGVWVSVIEPAAVASEFVANVANVGRQAAADPYAEQLGAYLRRTQGAFAAAQPAASAGAAIADAATAPAYRFRWHTSEQAAAFAGLSLADLDGERVLGMTRTWVS